MGVEGSAAVRPRFNSVNSMGRRHFRLVTLGWLALERADDQVDEQLAGLNARRRKVALLAVLALARRPVSRDVLVEMFWGDQEEARARHSLSDAVSHLRRVLGRDAIVATRSEVSLAPGVPLVVDAVELASSKCADESDDGAAQRVLALYGGPFLGGVHVEGSSSFEQWAERERLRLERVFVRAARLRCEAFTKRGEWAACGQVAERWLEAEPLSVEAGVTYLESLSNGEDESGRVLAAYERLRARLRREYDVEPDARVAEIAARIEASRRERVVVRAGGPPPTSESDAISRQFHHPSNAPHIDPPLPVPTRRPPRPHVALGLLTVVLVAAAFVAGAKQSAASGPAPRSSTVVAIAGIEPTGTDSSLAWLADGLPHMLSAKLSRSTDVEVVPPVELRAVLPRAGTEREPLPAHELLDLGRRVGATVVVSGGISRTGQHAVLDLEVRALADGSVRHIDVSVERDLMTLVDRAAVQLLDAIRESRHACSTGC